MEDEVLVCPDFLFQNDINSCFVEQYRSNKGENRAQRDMQEALLTAKKFESKRSFQENSLFWDINCYAKEEL